MTQLDRELEQARLERANLEAALRSAIEKLEEHEAVQQQKIAELDSELEQARLECKRLDTVLRYTTEKLSHVTSFPCSFGSKICPAKK